MSKSRPSKSRAAILPTPDFAWDPTTRPPVAGLRPYREQTYRLEPEVVGSKFVVHNYGHGGAGITLSWGCAHEVVDVITAHGVAATDSVAALGAGVMGLTAATLLLARNLKVTVYAKEFPPQNDVQQGGRPMGAIVGQPSGFRAIHADFAPSFP
jgi:D-amino-acid oxidase